MTDKTFADYDLREETVKALADQGITAPFPIQALTLPVALTRHDIIGQAKTGTGKTLGFGLPLLEHVVAPDEADFDKLVHGGWPQALVVVPTRELCRQVAGDLRNASKYRQVRICDIYGGVPFEPQIESLTKGVEVVVGTPGRLLDLMRRRILHLEEVKTIVLDEADEMLDLGFLPDVEMLLSKVNHDRHAMLFSATMPGPVIALARRFMSQPTHIRTQDPDDQGATVKNVSQFAYRCHAMNKIEVLSRILQANGRGRTIVFVRTKRSAAQLYADLAERGFSVVTMHGDLGQVAREKALKSFRSGKADVLIATDVAARGIDVDDVTHVVNYQCPEDDATYLHRVGRTGRAGAGGTAITFVDWDDLHRWKLIAKTLGLPQDEPAETYHTSAHLYEDLDIPEGITGRLPRSQARKDGQSGKSSQGGKASQGRGETKEARKPRAKRTAGAGGSVKRRRRRVNRSRDAGGDTSTAAAE